MLIVITCFFVHEKKQYTCNSHQGLPCKSQGNLCYTPKFFTPIKINHLY